MNIIGQTRACVDITIDIVIYIAYIHDIKQSVVYVCVKVGITKGDMWTELFEKKINRRQTAVFQLHEKILFRSRLFTACKIFAYAYNKMWADII